MEAQEKKRIGMQTHSRVTPIPEAGSPSKRTKRPVCSTQRGLMAMTAMALSHMELGVHEIEWANVSAA